MGPMATAYSGPVACRRIEVKTGVRTQGGEGRPRDETGGSANETEAGGGGTGGGDGG